MGEVTWRTGKKKKKKGQRMEANVAVHLLVLEICMYKFVYPVFLHTLCPSPTLPPPPESILFILPFWDRYPNAISL